jgi:hypothetical protein
MSSIDLAKLADLLSDNQSGEDTISVHRKIDRLISGRKPGWTESATAIVAIVTLFFGIFATGFTGYLNLREPLKAVEKDVIRFESLLKDIQCRITKDEIDIRNNRNSNDKEALRLEYSIGTINGRLNNIEKFIGNYHGNVFMEGTKGSKP